MQKNHEIWKSLIRNSGLFILIPLVFTTFKISEKNVFPFPGNVFQKDIKSTILSRPLCVAKEYIIMDVKEPGTKNYIKVPSAALFKYMSKRLAGYKYRVVRVRTDSSEIRLKSIRVDLIKEDSGYAIVSGLNAGDSLLINPKNTLKELVKADKLGLRKAFAPL